MLQNDKEFNLTSDCVQAFNTLKYVLTHAPIITTPDWTQPFLLMCDTNDFVVGAVLAQHKGKLLHSIYYANKTLIEAHINYITMEKELLVVVFAFKNSEYTW